MLVYLPVYLFSFVGTYFAEIFKNRYQKDKHKSNLFKFILIVFLIFAILSLLSVTRYGIGRDYFFSDSFQLNNLRDGKPLTIGEPFIVYLMNFIVNHNLPNQVYFVILGLITNAFFIGAIFINKDNKFLLRMFVYIFYCLFISSLNQTRQSVGIALGMFSLALIINYFDKWYVHVIAFVITICSIFFHYSEIINIVILLIYILFRLFIHKLKMKYLIVICFVIIAISPILLLILKYTIEYIPILNRYSSYILGEDTSTEKVWKILGSIFMYIVPMFTLVMFLLNFTNEEDYRLKLILVYLSENICFMLISTLLNNLMTADRLRTMVYGVELFIFPYLFDAFKDKGKTTLTYRTVTMLLMICITLGTYNVAQIYPYRSIFFKDFYIY